MRTKYSIPDRWLSYRNIGEPVSGTRFVAFKVPLGERYSFKLRTDERFSPSQLFEARPDLGLVIDLTNTDRYYPSEWFERNGVIHQKIACPGKAIPAERLVRKFCDVVRDFLHHTASKGSLIGVHCTHGINRTGYMICSYMIRQMQMNPRDAITAFEAARGHTIERKEYIDALLKLRSDGSVSNMQRLLDDECSTESGPSSSTGTIGFGHRRLFSQQWNPHPDLPNGVVHVQSNSPSPVCPSTSTRAAWGSVTGPEVNVWSATSGSADSTWSSIPGPVADPSWSKYNLNIAYSTMPMPQLNTVDMNVKTNLPYVASSPHSIEPAHSSTEYGPSQRERPIVDGFSEPGRSQHIRYGELERREALKRRSAALGSALQFIDDSQPILEAYTSEPLQSAFNCMSSTTYTNPPRSRSPLITHRASPDLSFGSHRHLFGMPTCNGSCLGSKCMYQEESNCSLSWHRFYPDESLPKTRKFDQSAFKAIPHGLIAPNKPDDSSDDLASTSSWDSRLRSLKRVSDSSNDIDVGQQFDIGSIPRPERNSGIDFGFRYSPYSVESGSPTVLNDSAEKTKPRDGGCLVSVGSQNSPVNSFSISPAIPSSIMTHRQELSPQTQHRAPTALEVLEGFPAHIGPRNEYHVDHELTPGLNDQILDRESVLASLHRRTYDNPGRASKHAIFAPATSSLEGRNEQPLRYRVDIRASQTNPDLDWSAVLASLPHQRCESPVRASQYSMPSAVTPNFEGREDNYEPPTPSVSNTGVSHASWLGRVSDLSKISVNRRNNTGVTDQSLQAEPYDYSYSANLPLGSETSPVPYLQGVEHKAQRGEDLIDLSDGQHSQMTSSPAPSSSPSILQPPLPSPIEPIPLVSPAMPTSLPVPPQVLEDLPNPSDPPNEFNFVERVRESRLDWVAILADLHRHTRMSAGRASRHAMPTSQFSTLEGRDDHQEQVLRRSPSFRYPEDPQTPQDEPLHERNERQRRRNRLRHRRGAQNGRSIGREINGTDEGRGVIVYAHAIARASVGPNSVVSSLEVVGASGRTLVGSGVGE